MARKIELVGGRHTAAVDDEDFDRVSALRWYEHKTRGSLTVYAKAMVDGETYYMHQVVMGDQAQGGVVDHIDRNGLNNTKANLRIISQAENARNWGRDPSLAANVHRVTARGRTYYYWQPGRSTKAAGLRIRLSGTPDSPGFWEQVRNLNATHIGKHL